MPANNNNRVIVILVGVLFAVVSAAAALYFLLPSNSQTGSNNVTSTTATPTVGFDISVFQKQTYQQLNRQLMQAGTLPVQPPTTAGKANPFL